MAVSDATKSPAPAEALAVEGFEAVADRIRHVCISCHDFVADETGDDALRTRAEVERRLRQLRFELTERKPTDHRPWAGSYVYGRRER